MSKELLTITESKLSKCFDRPSIRIKVEFRGKKPLITNWPNYYEPLTILQLLAKGFNYGIRTGKKIGNYYFVVIDLDDFWAKERMKEKRYIQTAHGVHVYCLIKELPKNCWLFNQRNNKIGELHSLGRFVVGFGSTHQTGIRYSLKGRNNLKWFNKFEILLDLKQFLNPKGIILKPWGWKKD
jgi:hypothetical protein